MKRVFIVGIVLVVLAGGAWAGVFYFKNLRGIGPALRAPSGDIAELLSPPPQSDQNVGPGLVPGRLPTGSSRGGGAQGPALQNNGEGENDTGMPLTLPPGFSIEIFAKDLPGARVMAMDLHGGMYVTRTRENRVTYLQAEDGKVVRQFDVFGEMNRPHGLVPDPQNPLVFYIAQEDKIVRIRTESGAPIEKIVDLPGGGNHFTRTLGFGSDGRLYVSIGSSCNACYEKDKRRASIQVVDIKNKKLIPYAEGLRNSVFFTWSYVDGRMWATEMGRDLLGDDLPPDEINIIFPPLSSRASETSRGIPHYGWPGCYGKNVLDAVLHDDDDHVHIRAHCAEPFELPSYIDLPAHVAPLGLAFVPEEGWPEQYWYDLLVAFHGSWNRSVPVGYKIARLRLDAHGNFENTDAQGNPVIEDFISGWLQPDGGALGRPVDILVQPGGIMYISDDKAGVVYRVTYQGRE